MTVRGAVDDGFLNQDFQDWEDGSEPLDSSLCSE